MAEETKKKKLPSTFANMVIVLTVISLISALALAFTFKMTEVPRIEGKRQKTITALREVLPEFDNKPDEEMIEVMDDGEKDPAFKIIIYPARKGSELVGVAVKSYSKKAFGEPIWLMVGFDKNKKIVNISVLEQKETPGLGTKMADAQFKDQFKDKEPQTFKFKVKKDQGNVDAISAATISSRAFCDAVDRAYRALDKAPGGGVQ